MDRQISNPKIKTLKPVWADFKGFSFLFDNPTPNQKLSKEKEQVHELDADASISFYAAIQETLDHLGKEYLLSNLLLCLLPLNSYHVTLLDGLNDKNKSHLNQELTTSFQAFLDELPQSLLEKNSFTHFKGKSLQKIAIAPIVFEYKELKNWRNKALAITLKPTRKSQENYRKLLLERRSLSEQYLGSMGIKKSIPLALEKLDGYIPQTLFQALNEKVQHRPFEFESLSKLHDFLASILGIEKANQYLPFVYERLTDFTSHVSLGYFANTEGGRLAVEQTDKWKAQFKQSLSGKTIAFDSYSLYGFLNMAEYVKAKKGT